MATTYRFEAFISYASEDRTAVAAPLVAALAKEVPVWFDQNELLTGQQVHGRITEGLRESRFVIAVLSPDYLRKDWPQLELAAAPGRVIPVLHGITREQLKAMDPLIAQVKSLTWDDNERAVVQAILDRIRSQPRTVRSDVAVVLAHNQTDWDDLETAIDERLPNVTKLTHGFFDDAELLAATRVLIMPPPREYRLTRWEIDQVEKWVQRGGGLLLMGHYAERHHEMNVGEVAWRFNLEFGDDVLMPPSRLDRGHARSVKPHYAVGAVPSAGTTRSPPVFATRHGSRRRPCVRPSWKNPTSRSSPGRTPSSCDSSGRSRRQASAPSSTIRWKTVEDRCRSSLLAL